MATYFGLLEFVRMPFGIGSAAETSERFMCEVACGLGNMHVYMDDISLLIHSEEPNYILLLIFLNILAQRSKP